MKECSIFFSEKGKVTMSNKEFRMKKKRNTIYLPEDLLVKILSRVPEASLVRFRSISKVWNALIKKEEILAKKSLIIMVIDLRVYLASVDIRGIHDNVVPSAKVTRSQFSLKDPLSISSDEVDICDVFHCDGLLLCTTQDNRLVVWNPCSGETRWIQPRSSYKGSDTYALGKSSCNKYKILRVDQHGFGHYQSPVEYEIYDLSSNSWRSVGKTRDWSIPEVWSRGMSVNGNTYWLALGFIQDPPWTRDILLSFDFSKESFGIASLPVPGDHLSYTVFALSVTREEQKLCLLASCGYDVLDVDVWMATKIEITGAISWRKFLTVKRNLYQKYIYTDNQNSFLADRENKVVVCPGGPAAWFSSKSFFLHIVGEDKHIQVDRHSYAGCKRSLLLSYVPYLVQIQQKSSGVIKPKESTNDVSLF